ncbi:MAG: aminotransferase class I/II-fold pyridoxal phosphate-dependent enzyme [Campylobacteraceae bacterium]|nr:aminotransferase class I/II-fold pyridoxal phosphate-dependent enzyme [Campylobacteraceae bacterium]
MTQYSHGGDVESFALQLSCDVKDIIDLSSNINFIKPQIDVDFNELDISAYPTYKNLYKTIATNYQVKSSQCELFNGGSSAIFSLFRHLDLKHCTLYSPAYLEYKKAANVFGYKISHINRLNIIEQIVEEHSFVIFVNPSTPDGQLYDINLLMKYWIQQNCTILVDESFLDFTNGESMVKYLKEYDKLYILKSMTKFYSSAGIRVGTLLSQEKNIESLKSTEPMWKLSQFDSIYLQEALKDKSFKSISKSINAKNSILLERMLKESKLFSEVFASNVNFILAQLKNMNAQQFQEKLLPYKILIRDCSNFDFLDNSYVRIAVKSEKNLKQLQLALISIS